MKCPRCDKEIDNDSVFCEYCGKRIKKNIPRTIVIFMVLLSVFAGVAQIIEIKQLENVLEKEKKEYNRIVEQCNKTKDSLEDVRKEIKEIEDAVKYNGHEYVDLGLPSGLKWATCNVGADKPEEYGNYYAWGEITTKTEYTRKNSYTCGKQMKDIKGDSKYDAARANWGGSWRLPTKEELIELKDKCTWKWTTQNGVKGCEVTGPNGNHIFLPAAGGRDDRMSFFHVGYFGLYWSSTPNDDYYDGNAFGLNFNYGVEYVDVHNRDNGRTVRPVSE